MSDEPESTARLRHIGRTLRTIREREGKTQPPCGADSTVSPASLSTIENGTLPLRPRDLKYILYEYGVPDPERANLVLLAEQERRPGWWNEFKDIASRAERDHASLEYDAAALDAVEMQFVPGLLQTEDYARAIMRRASPKACSTTPTGGWRSGWPGSRSCAGPTRPAAGRHRRGADQLHNLGAMTRLDLSRAVWRKSSHSGSGEGACVEVARIARAIAVRDSKNPDGPTLAFSPPEWRGLLAEFKSPPRVTQSVIMQSIDHCA